MLRFIKEPIQVQVVWLTIVLVVTASMLAAVHFGLNQQSEQIKSLIHNQIARRDIGLAINQRLIDTGMLLYKLISLTDARDLPVLKLRLDDHQLDMQQGLTVLQNGGTYEDVLATNIPGQDEVMRTIGYRKVSGSPYVLEVLELAPRLFELDQGVQLIYELVDIRMGSPETGREKLGERISNLMKVINSNLQRSREDSTRVLVETEREIAKLEAQFAAASSNYSWIRLIVVLVSIVVTTYLLFFTLVRIGKITADRKRAEENVRLLLDTAAEGIYGLDQKGYATFVNPAASRMLGYQPEELIGRENHALIHHTRADGTPYPMEECRLHAARLDGDPQHVDDEVFWRKDGSSFYVEYFSTPIYADGELAGTVVNFSDISDRRQAERLIEHQASYDDLTDLPNRRLLVDRLDQALARCKRHGHMGAVVFLDLDHFKNVNDSLGHPAGDALLRMVATRLTQIVREEDTVARLGGDEFVLLLSEISDDHEETAKNVQAVAGKIREAIAVPYTIQGNELHVTPSIGLALFPMSDETADDVLKNADTAMYRAKYSGRNSIAFFLPSMQLAAEERLQLQNDLRTCIANRELRLHIQPQMNVDGHLTGAEVLLRWQHPERGLVMPDKFIPAAEETGQILAIGEWVLREACRLLGRWSKEFPGKAFCCLAVNVSPVQFSRQNFAQQIQEILQETAVDPRRLTLELTEGVLLKNVEDTIEKMEALKRTGIRFSIDDFGTGYSSLAYLKRLPVDEIKIDRSFVRDVTTDPGDANLVETIIDMATNLHLEVVAEGVESEEELAFLVSCGCNLFQGYYFSQPLPAEEFRDLLEKQ